MRVDSAARAWAHEEAPKHPGLLRLGYFGSYSRGDWGVGSDLDLVAVVEHDDSPFERRGSAWNLLSLPVPAEILVYTTAEWDRLHIGKSRFAKTLARETTWLWRTANSPSGRRSATTPSRRP